MTRGSVPCLCLVAFALTAAGYGPEPASRDPVPAPAQSTSIGVYLDPAGTRSSSTDVPIGYPFSLYVVLKGMNSLTGWEASVISPFVWPDAMVLDATLLVPGSIDFGTGSNNWIVAMPGCADTGPDQALAVLEYEIILLADPCDIGSPTDWVVELGPAEPSSFAPPTQGWFDCASVGHPFDDTGTVFLTRCLASGLIPYFVEDPTASPSYGSAPLEVQFTAVAFDDDTPQAELQYYWFFDDGGTAVGQSPSHTYSSPGTYLAWVNVYDGDYDKSAFVQVDVSVTGIGDPPERPVRSIHVGASPNPFRSRTQLSYALPESGPVSVRLFDHRGRLVRTLDAGERPAGDRTLVWDGKGDQGVRLPAGIYVGRVRTEMGAGIVRIIHLP